MKKNNVIKMARVLAIIVFISATAVAQRPGRGYKPGDKVKDKHPGMAMIQNLPDITEGQLKQIDEHQTQFLKESLPIKKKLMVKRAELDALSTQDNVDMKELNKKIDEISGLKSDLMKKHEAYKQKIRSTLNEKQRIYFDHHPFNNRGARNGNFRKDGRMRHHPYFAPGMQGEDDIE